MPIKIQHDLPAREILNQENIFVMDETRAIHQDIRPIKIAIVNLMPLKEATELQLLRALSNTPLQVDVSFVSLETHESTHTALSHLNRFYEPFSEISDKNFDGMIITGAPVEQLEFEEVDYFDELCKIMEWSKKTRHFDAAPLLGRSGRSVLSLRDQEAPVERKTFRYLSAPAVESQSSARSWF